MLIKDLRWRIAYLGVNDFVYAQPRLLEGVVGLRLHAFGKLNDQRC